MESLTGRRTGWVRGSAVLLGALLFVAAHVAALDYNDALMKSLKYFEAQRSGKLPTTQRVTWRGDSGMSDGLAQGIDLTGGYYDAGDNVKYGLPMAFTITMLSWSVIQYRQQLQAAGQLDHALEAIKWGTDYFIKAHPSPDVLWGEVGDGDTDHQCWMRPEDMTTSRQAYKIDADHPGSDLAGETAAAMAAASIVFKSSDPQYSATLLTHARQLFTFADTYRGTYDTSISVAQKYYKSWSGYDDELLWAAIWLHDATGADSYLKYVVDNADSLGGTGWALDQFSWDNKYVGVQLKATKVLLDGNAGAYTATLQAYQAKAEYFLCAALQKNSGKQLTKSPGGMFWIQYWNNMQYVTTAAFLLTVASDYYTAAHQTPQRCTSAVSNAEMLGAAQQQVDYILGKNSRGTSYFIGFGSNFPQRVHHRAASINARVGCTEGFNRFYLVSSPNPYVLEGAVVGGPDVNDLYQDVRNNYAMSEPALYNTAPLVGVLARLSVGGGSVAATSFPNSVADLHARPHRGPSRETHHSRQSTPQPLAISQALVDQWVLNGKRHFKFDGKITNNSHRAIKSATVVAHKLYGALWGLDKARGNGNIYTLPLWIDALEPGHSVSFAYIHSYGKAQLYLLSYALA